jgi:putative oxidoreductase
MERYSEAAYALLRVVAGLLFLCHGLQKVFGVLGGHKVTEGLLLLGGWIELVGGALVALGLFAVPAAIIASGEMAAAYFKSHAPQSFWPIENKGELAVLYCFLFLFIALRGAGPFSLAAMIRRRRPGV